MAQKEGLSVELLNQHFEVCVSVLRFLTRKNYRVYPKKKEDGSNVGSAMKTSSSGSVSGKANGSVETEEGSKAKKDSSKEIKDNSKETKDNSKETKDATKDSTKDGGDDTKEAEASTQVQ